VGQENGGFSRRKFLEGAGIVGAGLAIPGLLTGFASSSGASVASAGGANGLARLGGGKPVRGGTFTVGVLSAGQEENLFPGTASTTPDYVRDYNLYNLLFYTGTHITPIVPGLALSAEPNSDSTVWTFKLRGGVTWHDGKPFGADDVVYNFQTLWSNANLNFSSGILAGLINYSGVKALDNLTVQVPLNVPVAQFPTLFTFYSFPVVQNGATVASTGANPIGTGPFKYESFTPGSQSVFVANKDYWETGKPYVERLVVDSSFSDTNSLFDALLGGKINLYPTLPFVNARQQISSKQVQILEGPVAAESYMFTMRVDKGPFADNRIREGFKLLVDRQAMVDGAWSGFGTVATDLICPATEYYASDLKRTQDVDKAKSLFKAAGVSGHTFTLPICDFLPGMVESATILAQQAQAAGVKVSIDVISAATYFTPASGYGTRPFGYEVNQPAASLLTYYQAELTPSAPYLDTHWGLQSGGKADEKLISQAIAATKPAKAKELWHQCQQQQFNEGGYLVWGNAPYVDAAANNVRGLAGGSGFSYNNWRLCDGWIV
jgi:peptide/nickel transport system substrate-binding protein